MTVLRSLLRAIPRRVPLERNEDIVPFFIVGSGRCGTTLLRRLLSERASVHIPPETYVLGPLIRSVLIHPRMTWDDLVRAALSRLEYHPHFGVFEVSLRDLAVELYGVSAQRQSLAVILNAFYRYHARASGNADALRWADKTPLNINYLDELFTVFPRVRFVNLIRDGVDVAASMVRKGGNEQTLDQAARRWVNAIESAERFTHRHPHAIIDVRYEDLVVRPESVLADVALFLDLPLDAAPGLQPRLSMTDVSQYDHHQQVDQPVSTDSIGLGRRDLTPADRTALSSLNPHLQRLGYDPVSRD